MEYGRYVTQVFLSTRRKKYKTPSIRAEVAGPSKISSFVL